MTAELRVLITMEAAWHRIPGGTGRVAVELANALSRRDDIEIEGVFN